MGAVFAQATGLLFRQGEPNRPSAPVDGIVSAAGALVSLFVPLVFGGALSRIWADAIFGPQEQE